MFIPYRVRVEESSILILLSLIDKGTIVTGRVERGVAKKGDAIEAVEIQFADYSLIETTKDRLLPATKKKSASEGWSKRRRNRSTDSSYNYH